MSKRNAIRIGYDPNAAESVLYTVRRYGAMKQETFDEIVAWLENHKDEYEFETKTETILDRETKEIVSFLTIKTQRKGSVFFKVLDNEHDAQNTLANIRNKSFPKNKQGQ